LSNIHKMIKEWDFNQTEPETLKGLVESASNKGKTLSTNFKKLHNKSNEILSYIKKENFIKIMEYSSLDDSFLNNTTIGIDGSFQKVGGVGGKWFVPMSVVRILFDKGLSSEPIVDVYSALVEEIDEQEEFNVELECAKRMLTGETKAISDWAKKYKSEEKAIIYLDGPIVDPPFFTDDEYVSYRCNALEQALNKSHIIGCVKRSRERFLLDYIKRKFEITSDLINLYPSDQHLISSLFRNFRKRNKNLSSALCTKVINVSSYGVNRTYSVKGISIFSCFVQVFPYTKILRVDFPIIASKTQKIKENHFEALINNIIKWTLPGQDVPLPILLAHFKCNIRKGCADVLYEEIMTRGIGLTVEDRILLVNNLR